MANRNYNRKQALEKESKEISAQVAIGASGAPTLSAAASLGVASIVRNSAGLYTLTLQDKYMRLISVQISQQAAVAEDLQFQVAAEDVDGAKTVQFRCVAGAVETDPSSGSTLRIHLNLKNSSAR